MIDLYPSNDIDMNEENLPPAYSTINKPATVNFNAIFILLPIYSE